MTREEQRRAAMTSLNYPPGTRLDLDARVLKVVNTKILFEDISVIEL